MTASPNGPGLRVIVVLAIVAGSVSVFAAPPEVRDGSEGTIEAIERTEPSWVSDTDQRPRSWERHTWHYPVVKRPLSTEAIEEAAEAQVVTQPEIRLAGGEYEIAVLGVHPTARPRMLQQIVVDTRPIPPGYEVSLYYLPPFTVETKSRWFDTRRMTGEWLDPCVPLREVPSAHPGAIRFDASTLPEVGEESLYLLLEVKAPRFDEEPDAFSIHLAFETDTGVYPAMPLKITPFHFNLPFHHTLPLLAWLVPEDVLALHRTYGLLPEDEDDLWLDYLTVLREHRIVPYNPTPQRDFDWDLFEKWALPLYRGDLTPDGVPAPAIRFPRNRESRGSEERVQFYRDVAARLRDEGILDRAFYYIDDEPLINEYTRLIDDALEIRRTVPDLRIFVTEPYNAALDGLIDIWCPDIAMYNHPLPLFPVFGKGTGLYPDFQVSHGTQQYRAQIEEGRELWMYTCMSAQFFPLPNLFIDAVPAASRIIPWVLDRNDATGMIHFRLSHAYKDGNDPWKNQYYYAANGDGTLMYPGHPDLPWFNDHGGVASIRMKLLRDGLEDYEYLQLLGDTDRSADQVQTMVSWQHDLAELVAARTEIGEEIEAPYRPVEPRFERFNQISQPSVTVDVWYLPEWAVSTGTEDSDDESSGASSASSGAATVYLVPSYRHLLVSSFETRGGSVGTTTRGRWQAYLQAGPLLGVAGETADFGGYTAVGWTVSPETSRRLDRNWLIPYVGLEGGAITGFGDDLGSGDRGAARTGGAASVLAGIHLWSSPKFSVALGGAWTYTTTEFAPMAFRGSLSVDFVLD